MTVKNIIEGLQIIEKYRPEKESQYHLRAEHDEIFAGSLDWPFTSEDKKKLKKLGWTAEVVVDGWRASV